MNVENALNTSQRYFPPWRVRLCAEKFFRQDNRTYGIVGANYPAHPVNPVNPLADTSRLGQAVRKSYLLCLKSLPEFVLAVPRRMKTQESNDGYRLLYFSHGQLFS